MKTMASEPPMFLASFTEAYSFRNLIALLRQKVKEANFIFSPTKIEITRADNSKTTLFEIEIKGSELKIYEYNAYDDETGDLLPCIAVGFNTGEMVKATKHIKKKDGLNIYMKAGDNNIYIQPTGTNTKDGMRSGFGVVPAIDVEIIDYEKRHYERSEDNPNAKILASDFSAMCATMMTVKAVSVAATGYVNGIMFKGILADKSISRVDRFGQCDNVAKTPISISNLTEITQKLKLDDISTTRPKGKSLKLVVKSREDLCTVHIPANTIKALSKINNVSLPSAMVKVYSEEGKALKLSAPIGTYGNIKVYLRDTLC